MNFYPLQKQPPAPLFLILFILRALLIANEVTLTRAQTALLCGANGAVGNEVLRAIVHNPFWENVIVVGRSFAPKVTDLFLLLTDNNS